MGALLCCSSKEGDRQAEVLRDSGAKVELEGVPWDQSVAEESWEAVFNEPGVRDDVFREVSPELSKDMASFPFSPRPLSPRSNSAKGGSSNQKLTNSVVQSTVQSLPRANSATGDEVYAHMMRNSGLQTDLQLPETCCLHFGLQHPPSSLAPFSEFTPGSSSGQLKIVGRWDLGM